MSIFFPSKILANNLYGAIGTKVETETKEMTAANAAQLLKAMLTVTVVSEAILRRRGFANVSFVATGEQRHFPITLKNLSIQSLNL